MRPRILSEATRSRVAASLQAGNYVETAAAFAGISASTFYSWMARGRAEILRVEAGGDPDPGEVDFVEFVETVEKARADAEVRAVHAVQKAANDGTWQAAAWFLERSHPQRWGRFQRTELSGPGGGPVQVDVVALEEKLRSVLGVREDPVVDGGGEG
jgi:transposase